MSTEDDDASRPLLAGSASQPRRRYHAIDAERPTAGDAPTTAGDAPTTAGDASSSASDASSTAGDRSPTANSAKVQMPRTLGALTGVAVVVGNIVGSGVFVSPRGVLARSGSAALSLCIWLACGLLATLGALCYIELGLLIPEAGGEFAYLLRGLGPLHRFWGPLPAFLFAWTVNVIVFPVAMATLALACSEYCVLPFVPDGCEPSSLALTLLSICLVWVVTGVNSLSTRVAANLQALFTFAKLAAMGIIITGGAYSLWQGNIQYLENGFQGSTTSVTDIATAFYSGLWAYDGWNGLNYLTEEMVNPARNLPLGILIGLPVVTACYVLTNAAYLTVLSPEEIIQSPAVAVTFAHRLLGSYAFLVPLGVAVSVFGALNGGVLVISRLYFASARQGHFLPLLSCVHVRRLTPAPALMFNGALTSLFLVIFSDVDSLIDVFSVGMWLFYGLVVITLLVLRRTRPHAVRPFRVPTLVACVVLVMAVYLVVFPVVFRPKAGYVLVGGFQLLGVAVYAAVVYKGWSPKVVQRLTRVMQKLAEVVPTTPDGTGEKAMPDSGIETCDDDTEVKPLRKK